MLQEHIGQNSFSIRSDPLLSPMLLPTLKATTLSGDNGDNEQKQTTDSRQYHRAVHYISST